MLTGVPKETRLDDHRVAISPQRAERLLKLGHTILVETGASGMANITDDVFREAGATIVPDGHGSMATGYAGVYNHRFLRTKPRFYSATPRTASRLPSGSWPTEM
jgi:NAD/NADP transhydrogenase alpha subunit